MTGWVLLVPFVLLGIFLSVRWMSLLSCFVILINVLVLTSHGVQNAGPGSYTGWGALGVLILSIVALFVMWLSASITWFIRKFVMKKASNG